jgi:phosphoglycolate phosphatase
MTATPPPLLLLFDIDGTLLLRASTEHAAAVVRALCEVHGIEADVARTARVEAAGRTDRDIVRQILRGHGVADEAIDATLPAVLERCAELYDPPDLSARRSPGIEPVLDGLAARADVLLSLVTGNIEAVARRKLAAAGLGHHFPAGQGGFGSDHEDRRELPPIARARAGAHPRERTIVIGDTPRDIACARADGLAVVGIATGPYDAAALAGADVVVGHAGELPAAIARIAGEG